MATVKDVIQEVQEEVNEGSLSVIRILAYINEGARLLTLGRFPQYQIPEICLKSLVKIADVTLVDSVDGTPLGSAGLTFEHCKDLISCTVGGLPLALMRSSSQIESYYPGLVATGTPRAACVEDHTLHVAPRNTSTATIQYFAYPATLTVLSTLDFLPDSLQMPLIKNYVLKSLTSKYLQGLDFDPTERFREAVMQLSGVVGTYSRKAYYQHNRNAQRYRNARG